MPRITHQSWWCWKGHKNSGDSRVCICGVPRHERHAQVHATERAVVYYNPSTGEHRTPPRADLPLPEVYAKQGFERREVMNMTSWERESGTVHEATNFSPGNEPSPERYGTPSMSRELKDSLIKDMSEAMASGPFTGTDVLV